MCKQTETRIFLEEFLERNFPNNKWSIDPVYYIQQDEENSGIPHQNNIMYYGDLYLSRKTEGDTIVFFDKDVPYNFVRLMFTGMMVQDYDSLFFTGYRVLFDQPIESYIPL